MKKKIAIGSIVFVLVLVSIYFYVAYNDSQQLNEEMSEIITLTIKEENVEKIEAFTKKVAGVGPAAKWFIDDYSEYEKFKQYYENYLIACANEVDKKISKLKPLDEIKSFDHYFELYDEIEAIEIDETTVFGKKVKEKVSNYSDFEKYKNDFEALLRTYKVLCKQCDGDGQVSCDYCNGWGKKTVTWYSEGDWGSKSYSSYDCTECGGDGQASCPNCIGGYYYDFG